MATDMNKIISKGNLTDEQLKAFRLILLDRNIPDYKLLLLNTSWYELTNEVRAVTIRHLRTQRVKWKQMAIIYGLKPENASTVHQVAQVICEDLFPKKIQEKKDADVITQLKESFNRMEQVVGAQATLIGAMGLEIRKQGEMFVKINAMIEEFKTDTEERLTAIKESGMTLNGDPTASKVDYVLLDRPKYAGVTLSDAQARNETINSYNKSMQAMAANQNDVKSFREELHIRTRQRAIELVNDGVPMADRVILETIEKGIRLEEPKKEEGESNDKNGENQEDL